MDSLDRLTQANQKLKREIDDLRQQNQNLRIQQLSLPTLILTAGKIIGKKIAVKLSPVQRAVKKLAARRYDENFNRTFKPYHVQLYHPVTANRPRVVHAIGNFSTGGSQRLIIDIVEHLGHLYEQEIIVAEQPIPPAYTGLNIHEYRYLTSPNPVAAYLKRFKADIVHVHYWGEGALGWYHQVFQAARQAGCKVIENVNIPVEPYVSDGIDRYVYVSSYLKDEYAAIEASKANVIIYPGSNFELFFRSDDEAIPDDCIGMVYRLGTDKINERAIDPFIKVAQRRKGTKVLIVGGGPYYQAYQEAVQKAGVSEAFTFTGYVSYEELPALYKKMSLFIAPVYRESFGQVTPFAMNMQIPVIGYDIGAIGEIINRPELLAPPEDSDRLAEIAIRLLNDRAKRLHIGKENHQRATELFSVQAMVQGYDRLYKELQTNR